MSAAHASPLTVRTLEVLTRSALACLVGVAAACGGGGGGNSANNPPLTSPTPTSNSAVGATINIGSSVDPRDVRIEVSQSVRFVNNGSRSLDLRSHPHPTHGSCPAIDASGTLRAGASVTVGPFTTAMACDYHDHNTPQDSSYHGRIRVGVDEGPSGPGYIR